MKKLTASREKELRMYKPVGVRKGSGTKARKSAGK
jgi:hypothetical protein